MKLTALLITALLLIVLVSSGSNVERETSVLLDSTVLQRANISDKTLQMVYSEAAGSHDTVYHFLHNGTGYTATNPDHNLNISISHVAAKITIGDDYWQLSSNEFAKSNTLDDNRLTLHHDHYDEWYVNGPVGLQQGFTLYEPSHIAFDVGGTLSTTAINQTLHIGNVLKFSGLMAYDAYGSPVNVEFKFEDDKLVYAYDDSDKVYPLTIDPWIQEVKLTGDGTPLYFGQAVGISGDLALVGAPQTRCSVGTGCGVVYAFERVGNSWTQQAVLEASDKVPGLGFGESLSLEGNTAIISAPEADCGSFMYDCGKTYVFIHSGGIWTEEAILIASDQEPGDWFGTSVHISGNVALIGAPGSDDCNSVVNYWNCGKAYLFVRNGTLWNEKVSFLATSSLSQSLFGHAVAIDGTTAVVGAPDANCSGIGDCGKAYVFNFDGNGVTWQATLIASDATALAYFGSAVAIDGDTIIIGAYKAGCAAGDRCGSAYVYVRNGDVWTEQATLTASDAAAYDFFGFAVAIEGDRAFVSATGEDSHGSDSGSVYEFVRSGSTWIQKSKLLANDNSDYLGYDIAIDGYQSLFGALAANDGGAYIFAFESPTPTPTPTNTPTTPLSAHAYCVGDNLEITIQSGDGPYNILADSAPPGNGPFLDVSEGVYYSNGPGAWTNVVVIEQSTDFESLALGDFSCPNGSLTPTPTNTPTSTPTFTPTFTPTIPGALVASAACVGDNLEVTISYGEGPFDIVDSGNNPHMPVKNVGTGIHVIQGPDMWLNVTIIEASGDHESLLVVPGEIYCADTTSGIIIPDGAPATTSGIASQYPDIRLESGFGTSITDLNVTLSGLGHTFPGDVNVLIVSPSGTAAQIMGSACSDNGGFVYDFTFDDEALQQIPFSSTCMSGTYRPGVFDGQGTFPAPAPPGPYATSLNVFDGENPNGNWSLFVIDDTGKNYGYLQGWSLEIADTSLQATMVCNGDNFEVNITSGEGPFNITSSEPSPHLPFNDVSLGKSVIQGPDRLDITVTETTGDNESLNLGSLECVELNGNAIIPGSAPDSTSGIAAPYPIQISQGGSERFILDVDFILVELGHSDPGDLDILLVSPQGTTVLLMSDACVGAGGYKYTFRFDNVGASQLPADSSCESGIYKPSGYANRSLPAPAPPGPYATSMDAFNGEDPRGNWSLYINDRKDQDYGDLGGWSLLIGSISPSATPTPIPLSVAYQCVGPDLQINIKSGDGPFDILASSSPSGTVLFDDVPTGVYTSPGPGTWLDVQIVEQSWDNQSVVMGDRTCTDDTPTPSSTIPTHTPSPTYTPSYTPTITSTPIPQPTTVVINEISFEDTSYYVEFYNYGNAPVNLENWHFFYWNDNDSTSGNYGFPDYTLAPHSYVKLLTGSGIDTGDTLRLGGDFPWTLGGAAVLATQDNFGVDFVRFGNSEVVPIWGTTWTGPNPPRAHSGAAIGRNSTSTDTDSGNDWCKQEPSAFNPNGECLTLHINEIYGGPDAYVELYNAGPQSVNLDGWRFEIPGAGGIPVVEYVFPETIVVPDSYLILKEGSGVNTGNIIYLGQDMDWSGAYAISLTSGGVGSDFVKLRSSADPPDGDNWIGYAIPTPRNLRSYGRDSLSTDLDLDDDWCLQVPSTGVANEDCGDMLITEVKVAEPSVIEIEWPEDDYTVASQWQLLFYDNAGNLNVAYNIPTGELSGITQFHEGTGTDTQTNFYLGQAVNWTDAGAIALMNGMYLIDFMRFGDAPVSPPGGYGWSGIELQAPSTSHVLARDVSVTDTDQSSDWCEQWPSLGGTNKACISIMINEFSKGGTAYIELFNYGTSAIQLDSSWKLETFYIDLAQVTYQFSNTYIPPQGYLTLYEGFGTDTATELYLNQDLSWGDSGAIRLFASYNGSFREVDFVRFGSSKVISTEPSGWQGANVVIAPAGLSSGRKPQNIDSNSANDWCNQTPSVGSQNIGCQGQLLSLTASATCINHNLEITISGGDGPFDITASAGINTPVIDISYGTTTITGPEKWDNLSVTEKSGDFESINLGTFKCRTEERPVPLAPVHRERTTNAFPTFSWTSISIANNYRLWVFDDANPATRTVDIRENSGGATSHTLTMPLPDGRLFWRVRGRQNRVWSRWSIRFTLFKDPVVPISVDTPVPTLNLNPRSGNDSTPTPEPTVVPAPTFPTPPNSR